jgi:hypothetical protein
MFADDPLPGNINNLSKIKMMWVIGFIHILVGQLITCAFLQALPINVECNNPSMLCVEHQPLPLFFLLFH